MSNYTLNKDFFWVRSGGVDPLCPFPAFEQPIHDHDRLLFSTAESSHPPTPVVVFTL